MSLFGGTAIAIGVTPRDYPTFRFPGWHSQSVGYHADGTDIFQDVSLLTEIDGHIYCEDSQDRNWKIDGNKFWKGDYVGCGRGVSVNGDEFIFFTKNGKLVHKQTFRAKADVFPTIAANLDCAIAVNTKVTYDFSAVIDADCDAYKTHTK